MDSVERLTARLGGHAGGIYGSQLPLHPLQRILKLLHGLLIRDGGDARLFFQLVNASGRSALLSGESMGGLGVGLQLGGRVSLRFQERGLEQRAVLVSCH